jgi:hypothetical protein
MKNGNTSSSSDDRSIKGENETGFFMSVSNLTTKKNRTG